MTALPMSENDLLTNVLDLAANIHVRTAHFRPAKTEKGWRTAVQGDGKGFPDLVLVGPGGVLWRELKNATNGLDADQRLWRDALIAAGANWALWRPKDWPEPITTQILALRRAVKETSNA
jgi:hypothetical protein